MNLVAVVHGIELDFDIVVNDPEATVRDLLDQLLPGLGPSQEGVWIDDRFYGAADRLGDVWLRPGSRLQVGEASAPTMATRPVGELRVVGGLAAGQRFGLEIGPYVLGSSRAADIVLDAPGVALEQARIEVAPGGAVRISALDSVRPVEVEGDPVSEPVLVGDGEMIDLGSTELRLVLVRPQDVLDRVAIPEAGPLVFNRPPRTTMPDNDPALRAPTAPGEAPKPAPFGWSSMLAGGAMMLANPVFGLLSPAMATGSWIEQRRQAKRGNEEARQKFEEGLRRFRRALAEAQEDERRERIALLPDPAEVIARATVPKQRLWERRPQHKDFMQLVAGFGTGTWDIELEGSAERPPEVDALLKAFTAIPRCPVPLDLRVGRTLGLVGDREPTLALLRSVVCQAAALHGPADLRIAVLTDERRAPAWDWVKWLPHVASVENPSRRLLASSEGEIAWVLSQLAAPAPVEHGLLGSAPAQAPGSGPLTLVVVDADGLTEGRDSPVRDLLAGAGAPVAGVVLAPAMGLLPALCTSVVELVGYEGRARCLEPATGLLVDDLLISGVPERLALETARSLSGIEDPEVEGGAAGIPERVPLLPLLGLDPPEPRDVAERWSRAGRVPAPTGILGANASGPLAIDLAADGPHGLVAGTTGSGKSELLRTLVASMAAGVSPDHLTFVLVDYKGGSAFDACARLPHTVGVVTDLDEHLAERALASLEAEVRYRERRLRDAEATDLVEYLRQGPMQPLPRLVVVVDEFASLAGELPDFVASLVDVARRGRSLGVHLILATQRPAGAVNEQIRANTNLRIALRVQDPSDSVDVVGVPSAASIGRQQAGRGYLRLGPGEVVAFQAGFVSGTSVGGAADAVEVRPFVFGTGDVAGPSPAHEAPTDAESDLERLVRAIGEAAHEAGYLPARKPWLPPLAERLTFAELEARLAAPGLLPSDRAGEGEGRRWAIPYGLADEPARQRQVVAHWDLTGGNLVACGMAGMGTTTALTTLALSAARRHSPGDLHLYGLDFGTGGLGALAALPHTGAVVGPADRERQERLIGQLAAEVQRRRASIAAGEVDAADVPGRALPAVIFLVDNYPSFTKAFDDTLGMATLEAFSQVLSDGPGAGVYTALTVDRPGAVTSAMSASLPNKLVFRLSDPYDYAGFGLSPRKVPKLPPGRVMEVASASEVQVAVPEAGLESAVAAVAPPPAGPWRQPKPVGSLPKTVSASDIRGALAIAPAEWFLPVGIGQTELAPVGFTLAEGDHAVVAGPPRSGKSTVLATLAELASGAGIPVVAVALRSSPLPQAVGLSRLVTAPADLAPALAPLGDGPTLLLIDDADLIDDLDGALTGLVRERRPHLHIVAGGRADTLRTLYGHFTQELRRSRQGIALRPNTDTDGELWQVVLPRRGPGLLPPGRGYLVAGGTIELVQVAGPEVGAGPGPTKGPGPA